MRIKGKRPAKDRILEAAFSLFRDQGIENTTTREIAAAAEVNEVTLFRHFTNKQGLAQEVLQYAIPKLAVDRLFTIETTGDLEADVRNLTEMLVELYETREEFMRFFYMNMLQYPEQQKAILRLQMPVLQWMAEYLKPYCKKAGYDPMEIVAQFMSPIIMRAVRWVFLGTYEPFSADRERFIESHTAVMVAALSRKQKS